MRNIYKDIIYFFSNESFLIVIMVLVFSQISGPLLYLSLLLVPYILLYSETKFRIDTMALLISLYSVSYALFTYLNGWYANANANILFNSILPPLFYLVGKYWGDTYGRNLYFLLSLAILILSIKPIIYVLIDIANTGQIINLSRSMELSNGRVSSSATNIGIQISLVVSGIGLLIFQPLNKIEKSYKCLLILLSMLGLLCVVHLINRTGVVVAIISLITCLIINIYKHGKNIIKPIAISAVLLVLVLIMLDFPVIEDILLAYNGREIDGYEASNVGGRTELWNMGLKNLFKYPFGQTEFVRHSYSHNYWLDTAATAGLFPFFLLLIITVRHITATLFVIKRSSNNMLLAMFITTNVGFVLTCFVEPVMEGSSLYVFLLFLFVGITQGYTKCVIK